MNITLYRNCHLRAQLARVEAPFIPFDGTENAEPTWREWQSLFRIHDLGLHAASDLCGLFSFKFEVKSNLSGSDVLAHIAAHPGHDIYTFNPYPTFGYYALNCWTYMARRLPGILERGQLLMDRAGTGIRLRDLGRATDRTALHCNHWVARAGSLGRTHGVREAAGRLRPAGSGGACPVDGPGTLPRIGRRVSAPMSSSCCRRPSSCSTLTSPSHPTAARAGVLRQCYMGLQREVITGFGDLVESWEPVAPGGPRSGALENLNRVVNEYHHASGGNECYPWHRQDHAGGAPGR